MVDTVVERFARTVRDRAEQGTQWRTSCDRALALAHQAYGQYPAGWDGTMLLDGISALALGIHLVTTTGSVAAPADVTRAHLETLQVRGAPDRRVEVWEPLLRAAGHDPAHPEDPVSAVWRQLITAPESAGTIDTDLLTTTRSGPPLRDGLDFALAPMWNLRF